MANHVSALKRMRQTQRRALVNRQNRVRLRHQIRELRRALAGEDRSAARSVFAQTVSVIDRSVQKGVIRKNTAARYKSRLWRRLNAPESGAAA